MGTDNTIRSIRIRNEKSVIERPIQLLYLMKLQSGNQALRALKHLDTWCTQALYLANSI